MPNHGALFVALTYKHFITTTFGVYSSFLLDHTAMKNLDGPSILINQKANKKRMASVAAAFTRAPWIRTPQQVVENLFRLLRPAPDDPPASPRPESKRVWASLLKGKTAVIQDVAEEMQRRDPAASKTRRRPWHAAEAAFGRRVP